MFAAGAPVARFDLPNEGSQYDVTADGQRFLVTQGVHELAPSPITVVINWTASLKEITAPMNLGHSGGDRSSTLCDVARRRKGGVENRIVADSAMGARPGATAGMADSPSSDRRSH
jgi:hypothetical protein